MLRASVIIPTYNNKESLGNLIHSIVKQTLPKEEYEIIVVDDNSTDASQELISQLQFEYNFLVINHSENLGSAAARNSGIKASRSAILLFIDADMEIGDSWVESHITPIENDLWDGAVGFVHHKATGKRNLFSKYLNNPQRGVKALSQSDQVSHRHFLFANASLKKQLLIEAGMFDENIYIYGGEELELAVRIEKLENVRLRYNPDAVSNHLHRRKLEDTFNLLEKFGANVVPYIVAKHPELAREFYTPMLDNPFIRKALMITVLNPIFFSMIKSLHKLIPERLSFLAIKYMLGSSVMKGYVSRPKDAVR